MVNVTLLFILVTFQSGIMAFLTSIHCCPDAHWSVRTENWVNECVSRNGYRINTTAPNHMIVVSFLSEDNILSDEIKICYVFEFQSNENRAFRFFGTPGIGGIKIEQRMYTPQPRRRIWCDTKNMSRMMFSTGGTKIIKFNQINYNDYTQAKLWNCLKLDVRGIISAHSSLGI